MFEGRLRDKKSSAMLKRLGKLRFPGGELDDKPLGVFSWDQPPDIDVGRAQLIAETGEFALSMFIESAAEFGDENATKRAWKAVEPDGGARAAIFTAHWLAADSANAARDPTHHFVLEAHERAGGLLREWFPWSDAEDESIRELVATEDVDAARHDVVRIAVARALGEDIAATLPGLAAYSDSAEALLGQLHWQICWKHAQEPYLRMADPTGLARWEARRAAE